MSFNITQPIISESAATKAAKDGSDFTNPTTWQSRMGIVSGDTTRRLAGTQSDPGLTFDGVAGTRVIGLLAAAIGTGDMTLWARLLVPTANPAVAVNIIGFASVAGATNVTGGTGLRITTTGGLAFDGTDGTNSVSTTTLAGFVSTYGGQWVDVCLTRRGTAWEATVNGVSVLTATSSPGVMSVTATRLMVGGGWDSGTATYAGIVQRAVVFNRRLTAAETLSLAINGIDPADQIPSLTRVMDAATRNGGFETLGGGGADVFGTWSEVTSGTGAVSAVTVGQYAGVNSLQLTRSSSGDSALVQQTVTLVPGRRYRMSFWAKTPTSGTLSVAHNPNSTVLAITQALTTTWTRYSVEAVAVSGSAGNLQVFVATGTTGTVQVDDLVIEQVGGILDWDLGSGLGTYVADLSGNYLYGEAAGGVGHSKPVRSGTQTIVRTLLHGDISAFAGVTKLFDLPANCGILRVEFDRTAAFDAGITLNVGTAGSGNRHVSAQSVASTGIVAVTSLVQASEANNALTPIYVFKSGSTTVGAVTLRITIEVRG